MTHVDGQGASRPVLLVYTVVMRKELDRVVDIIHTTSPRTFFTVDELRSVQQGIFPTHRMSLLGTLVRRKAK